MTGRQAVISLPLSQTVVLERFEAVERLSELFVITADVLCEEAVDFIEVLGKGALITVSGDSGVERSFSGLVFGAELVGDTASGSRFRLTMRPWLYPLSRNQDFVIFQKQSVKDIIQTIFTKRAVGEVDMTLLTKTYPARDYCVQYRESDFNFISRLMEEEGIYYFFEHADGKHKMVLCDDRTSHVSSAYNSLPYLPHETGVLDERVWRWMEAVETGSEEKATFRNFDFTQPRERLEMTHAVTPATASSSSSSSPFLRLQRQDAPGSQSPAAAKVEIYDFPADFFDGEDDRGAALTETAMLSTYRYQRSYRGVGDAILLACGKRLTISEHIINRLSQEYLITGLVYRVQSESYTSGAQGASAGAGEEPVIVEITATPIDQPWRAPQITEKPVARGPETAIVTGPDGETIYTDEYGRVKVLFHWDRLGQAPDPTCWIRVASASADNGFGHVALPRIGQEVLVDFVNGDPDQPLVIGSVYNGDKHQPYPLPGDKTRSVWRSHTINGGTNDYNEISMEDEAGSEVFNVQAQKDRTTLVKHDDTRTVGNNLTVTVQEGDEVREVQKGKRTTTIQQDESLTVTQGNMSTEVSMGNQSTAVKMGNVTMKVDLGSVSIEAMQSIELKVGASSVKLDQMGVTIKGMMIDIEGTVQLQAKGLMTQIEGTAMTQISGGIIMIG